jgi:hypothetical protein
MRRVQAEEDESMSQNGEICAALTTYIGHSPLTALV